MSRIRKFAVVGAGTAGLACAIALAQKGHSVVVFEKHPSLEPDGAGILMQPKGVRALDAIGCAGAFRSVASPIHRLQLHNHRNQRLVDILYDDAHCGFGVTRGNLTQILKQRLRETGAELHLGTNVHKIVDIRDSVHLRTSGQAGSRHEWHFDAVVLASGSGSPLASSCGFGEPAAQYPWGALNGIIEVEAWPHTLELRQRVAGARRMMGLLPSGWANGKLKLSFYWSLHATTYQTWQSRDWAEFAAELARHWPEAAHVLPLLKRESLSFARYRHSTPHTYARGNLALVGDAAHAMSPQLGLGSTLALEDALALAEMVSSDEPIVRSLARYSEVRLPAARMKQRISKALTPFFQSRIPAWVRDPLFIVGQHVPGVERLMRASLSL